MRMAGGHLTVEGMIRYMPEEAERFVSLDQLPDDPLSMPPPYWRGGVGIFIIERNMAEIAENLLPELVAANEAWNAVSDKVDLEADVNGEESPFPEELDILMDTESEISNLASLTSFMAAIGAEEAINQFAVFNLHKDSAEAIEKLGPPDKLILVAAMVGAAPVKGTAAYQSIRQLTAFRNAAAHGRCVDRPTTSLRKNHLIHPAELPALPTTISELDDRLNDYFLVKEYLRRISKNPYTSGPLTNDRNIADSLAIMNRYRFVSIRGQAYDIQPPAEPETSLSPPS
jgi:hypothetical protein